MSRDWFLEAKRVAIYARCSTKRQLSVSEQVHRCYEYIVRFGGEPSRAKVFIDDSRSGGASGLESLMVDVRAGCVDLILVEDVFHISRNVANSADVFRSLHQTQTRLISLVERSASEMYLDHVQNKTLRGMKRRKQLSHLSRRLN